MSYRNIVLKQSGSQATGTTTYSGPFFAPDGSPLAGDKSGLYVAARWVVEFVSGSGTLDVYLQQRMPDGSFEDVARITQLTTAGKRVCSWVASGEEEYAPTDGTITAGAIRNGPIGGELQLKAVVATAAVVWKSSIALQA